MAQQKPIAAALLFFFFFFFCLFFFVSHYCIKSSNTQMLWLMASILHTSARREPACHPSCSPLPQTAFSLFVSNIPNSPVLLEPSSLSSSSTSSFSKNTSHFSLSSAYKQLSSIHCFILLPPVIHGSCIYALLLLNSPPLVSSG